MLKPLIKEVKVVDIGSVFNPSLRLWQWLLVETKEVRFFSPKLQQWLLIGIEKVKVFSPCLRL